MIALASEIGSRIGLSTAGAAVLTKLIGSTDKRDWTDPAREPIFYGQQETLAVRLLDDLLRMEDRPLTLFDAPKPKSHALMAALDQVNDRFGKKTMVLASEGMNRAWQLRSDHRSPRYTTRIADLPVVR